MSVQNEVPRRLRESLAIARFISHMTDGAIKLIYLNQEPGITSNNETARVPVHNCIAFDQDTVWFTAWLLRTLNHVCIEVEKTISYYWLLSPLCGQSGSNTFSFATYSIRFLWFAWIITMSYSIFFRCVWIWDSSAILMSF